MHGTQSSPFGPRGGRNHDGVDLAAPTGTPVRAAACGTVSVAGQQSGYGNIICITHTSQFSTCYAHLSRFATSQGAQVRQGQVIGYVGCTGNCTGPHLHFETRVGGQPQNPSTYLSGGRIPGRPTARSASAGSTASTGHAVAAAKASSPTAQTASVGGATSSGSGGAGRRRSRGVGERRRRERGRHGGAPQWRPQLRRAPVPARRLRPRRPRLAPAPPARRPLRPPRWLHPGAGRSGAGRPGAVPGPRSDRSGDAHPGARSGAADGGRRPDGAAGGASAPATPTGRARRRGGPDHGRGPSSEAAPEPAPA